MRPVIVCFEFMMLPGALSFMKFLADELVVNVSFAFTLLIRNVLFAPKVHIVILLVTSCILINRCIFLVSSMTIVLSGVKY